MPFPTNDTEANAQGYSFKSRSTCRGEHCEEEIEWWETPRGKMIPIDSGTFTPHWKTCVDADRFR